MQPFERELGSALAAARLAAEIIQRHYLAAGIGFEIKDDGSPVTRADLEANAAIASTLRAAFPDDALLMEELPDDRARFGKSRVWIVDPLDGTKDFLARTGDFTVHVALAVDGSPAVAAVAQPAQGTLYYASAGGGAFLLRGDTPVPLRVSDVAELGALRVGISRHNAPPKLMELLEANGLHERAVRIGASAKYLAMARGELDALITLTTGEKEWDTCAPELVVREAGGVVTDVDGNALAYNQADIGRRRGIVASNGRCHEQLVRLARAYLPPDQG